MSNLPPSLAAPRAYPAYLPRRAQVPGIGLAFGLAVVSFALVYVTPYHPLVTEILVATLLGALIVNTPLRRVVGIAPVVDDAPAGPPDRFAEGLAYVGSTLARAAVILLGLKLKARFFRTENLVAIACVAAVSIPGAFMVAHVLGRLLRLRRPLVDVLAGGTMICGASAVNAIGPVVGARRVEQGVAIASIFVYSFLAMIVFHPIAHAFHVQPVTGGLWAGLAVNDLSSALAVGRMLDGHADSGGVMAAMSKSARILLLAPSILVFHWLRHRREPAAQRRGLFDRLVAVMPRFLLGYVALGVVRAVGDRLLPASGAWHFVLAAGSELLELLMVMVSASIGLNLDLRRLLGTGVRSVLVSGSASVWTTSISLAMLLSMAGGRFGFALGLGGAALAVVAVIYALVHRGAADEPAAAAEGPSGSPGAAASAAPRAGVVRWSAGFVGAALCLVGAIQLPAPPPAPPVAALAQPNAPGSRCPAGMTFIPGGEFQMGATDDFDPDELPVVTRRVGDFCMDVYEVTVREYQRCVDLGGCTPARTTVDYPNAGFVQAWGFSHFCNGNRPDRQDHPVNCVDWYQSEAYCRAHGGRLPTETEWEYAARGGAEQRRYPWGDAEPDKTRSNICGPACREQLLTVRKVWGNAYVDEGGDDPWPTTAPVGAFPAGRGRWGQEDLAGNVTEWVSGGYCPYDQPDCGSDEVVARGDGWMTVMLAKLRNARRNHDEPWHRSQDAGFRCIQPR